MSDMDEDILQRVVAGDLDPDSEEVRAAVRARPELAARIERLRELQGMLDAVGAAGRSDMASDAPVPDALSRRVDDVIERQVRPRRRSPWMLVLAAAAALLVVGLIWLIVRGAGSSGVDRDPDQMRLENPEHAELHPNDAEPVEDYFVFDWSDWKHIAGDGYRLTIYADEGADDWLIRTKTLEPSWTPNAAERRALPDHIYYTVEVLEAGLPGERVDAHARRSGR